MSAHGITQSDLATGSTFEPQIAALDRACATATEALTRMCAAVSTGQDALALIEKLRLENAMDVCRVWVRTLHQSFRSAELVPAEDLLRVARLQADFRALLRRKAMELSVQVTTEAGRDHDDAHEPSTNSGWQDVAATIPGAVAPARRGMQSPHPR